MRGKHRKLSDKRRLRREQQTRAAYEENQRALWERRKSAQLAESEALAELVERESGLRDFLAATRPALTAEAAAAEAKETADDLAKRLRRLARAFVADLKAAIAIREVDADDRVILRRPDTSSQLNFDFLDTVNDIEKEFGMRRDIDNRRMRSGRRTDA